MAVLAFTVASSIVGLLALWRHSEAERARAENALARAVESDTATSGAVRDLVSLLATTVDAPQLLVSQRFEKSSHVVRYLTAKLRRHRGFATSNLVAICELERQLAEDFGRRGNYAESRALLMDSLDLLEGRRFGPDDRDADEAYARALMELGWVAHQQERSGEAMVFLERAEATLENLLVHDPPHIDVIISINQTRRRIASLLSRSGLEGPRRRLMESHVRMLERLSERAGADPAIGLLVVLVRLDLAPDDGASTKLRAAIRKFPANRRLPARLKSEVASWIANDVFACPSGRDSAVETKRRLDPDAHADAVIRALEARCEALGGDPSLLPAAAFQVAGFAANRGHEQRNTVRLDDARHTAACLSAFAKTLIRRDPNEAAFHLVLSAAFVQESKNAWRIPDHAAIENGLRKALSEACTALRLDPRNADARLEVAILQDKLVALVSQPPSSR